MKLKFIFLILLLGIIYRLILTADGNFIFNMDNARDMVDVREMVVLGKMRLIGHTAAIEGIFYGPYWYYLSTIPFYLSGGHPYGSIIMLIALWAIGEYFILKLMQGYGILASIMVGFLWIVSNPVVLATFYAYNPNPAILLTPVFIYVLLEYLKTGKLFFSLAMFALAGTFFSFEIMYAVVVPVIILSVVAMSKRQLFMNRNFWLGVGVFFLVISPHIFFELKHNFFMLHSLQNYITNSGADSSVIVNPILRINYVLGIFLNTLLPIFMNFKSLMYLFVTLFIGVILKLIFQKKLFTDKLLIILLTYIAITILAFILIPFTINSWHWVGLISAIILLSGVIVSYGGKWGIIFGVFCIWLSIVNVRNYINDLNVSNPDPSLYKNELAAIDFIYNQAVGKNFKVYTYLPSVIDYPYQYLFWWRGLNKYGYVPEDYAYSPNKPQYISQKQLLPKGVNPPSSGLIYLLKEPDRNNLRHLWENEFKKYELISSQKIDSYVIDILRD